MISVRVDTAAVTRYLTTVQRQQIPFATASALNDVAFTAQASERAAFGAFFKHPRPFTKRSVMVTKATKAQQAATVFIRPEVAKYLAPYEYGGVHVVPGKAQLVPITLRLDQYGQLTKPTLAKLNAMAHDPKSGVFFAEIHGVRGYWLRSKTPRGTRRTGEYGTKGKLNTLASGRKTSLTLLALEETPRIVHQHLDFIANVTHQVQAAWPGAIERAMARALRTAR